MYNFLWYSQLWECAKKNSTLINFKPFKILLSENELLCPSLYFYPYTQERSKNNASTYLHADTKFFYKIFHNELSHHGIIPTFLLKNDRPFTLWKIFQDA